jgi:hypothetical protein
MAHQLKGVVPATGQGELPLILKKVGDDVESFVRNFPDTASTEEIRQQVLDSRNDSTSYEFRYLALAEQGMTIAALHEYRQDSEGHEVDAQSMMFGSPLVTRGFVSMPMLLHPQHQAGSDFRLLGRQVLERHQSYVIGFAQREASVLQGRMFMDGNSTAFMMQGVAWVDATTGQILRMKTWLLPGSAQANLANVTTTADFSEVHFKHDAQAFWLPRDVVVEVVWRGKQYTNRHHYSHYKLFSVEAGEKVPRS